MKLLETLARTNGKVLWVVAAGLSVSGMFNMSLDNTFFSLLCCSSSVAITVALCLSAPFRAELLAENRQREFAKKIKEAMDGTLKSSVEMLGVAACSTLCGDKAAAIVIVDNAYEMIKSSLIMGDRYSDNINTLTLAYSQLMTALKDTDSNLKEEMMYFDNFVMIIKNIVDKRIEDFQ